MIKLTLFSSYLTVLIIFFSFSAPSQNITVISKRKCAGDKTKEVKEATHKFKQILTGLVDEGKLINATAYLDSPQHRELFVIENESGFTKLYSEYERRIVKIYPELYQMFTEACSERKDTVINIPKLYPVIKGDFWSFIMPVNPIDEVPDAKINYNIVSDFTAITKVEGKEKLDSLQLNWGLADIGRIYNLHVGAGIPQKKINFVLAIHGWAIFSFLNNDAYQKKYKTDNPNLRIIKELNDAGVKFLVCGQAMNWMKVDKSMLVPQAKVTLTAQTTLTSYQLKGYAALPMKND